MNREADADTEFSRLGCNRGYCIAIRRWWRILGYLDRNAVRISGSRRLDPHTLHRLNEEIPAGQISFVYCTCVREATSVRVARELEKSGIQIAVIRGGLRAWKKAGLPIEPVPHDEMAMLPVFR